MSASFLLATYNCKHYKDKGPKFSFMRDLAKDCDMLFVQEHCLFKEHISKMCDLHSEFSITGTSAMSDDVPLEGRPHGGCAILWKDTVDAKISEVKCKHKRLCGIMLLLSENCSLLLLNAYMPCDGQAEDDKYIEYMEVLSEVEEIIHMLNPSHFIFGGDLNTDLSRITPHSYALRSFIDDFNVVSCIDLPVARVPYTFISHTGAKSRIDHFIMTNQLCHNIISCHIVDEILESDHVPVKITLDIGIEYVSAQTRKHGPKLAWYKAGVDEINKYTSDLRHLLDNIQYDKDVFNCDNVHCKCDYHREQLCILYTNIIDACLQASQCIPVVMSGGGKVPSSGEKCVPGWNEYVEPLKQEALYWHRQWKARGSPHQGEYSEMRIITRARYKRAVRYVMNNSDRIKMTRMAEAISENRDRDLWSEICKIKGRNNKLPTNVDGVVGDENISELFCDKYSNLYNSVSYDEKEMTSIYENIMKELDTATPYSITAADVLKGVKRLKPSKSDGHEGLTSDHIINAPQKLYVLLTLVFNGMLTHGFSPESMLVGTMTPIPKDRKQLLCVSTNFRAITLGSIFNKLFDWIILIKEEHALITSELQFGFKPKTSTTHCTYVLLETVQYYNARGSNVHTLLLNATKAFDRVDYCKLFHVLVQRNMSPVVLRLLLYMYTQQKLQVKWGSHISHQFAATNGVKQGGVLSPILFSVYMDGLFDRLKDSGVGCHMGNHFVGGLAYADDLTLLAPTLSALTKLVDICEKYAKEFNVKFNGAKSQYLVFKGRRCKEDERPIVVNGDELYKVPVAMHLGHLISSVDQDSITANAIAKFWRSFNMFMADFGNLYSVIKSKLFKQYCCSFYGAPLFLLSDNKTKSLCTSWRRALRKLWKVDPMTHCDIVAALADCMPLEMQLECRFIKFFNDANQHRCSIIRTISEMAKENPWSVSGDNFRSICFKYNMYDFNMDSNKLCKIYYDSLGYEKISNVHVLKEMVEIRDGFKKCDIFSMQEVEDIISEITLN